MAHRDFDYFWLLRLRSSLTYLQQRQTVNNTVLSWLSIAQLLERTQQSAHLRHNVATAEQQAR